MKILAILGARKNGNTTEIVSFFEKELKASITCDVEILYLSDYPIGFCVGCHNCIFLGEDKCPEYQAVKALEDKMLSADAVILASPGYMYSVTGIMKNFLDHVAYNCHRPKYFGKKIFLLSSCTQWLAKSVFAPMETWASASGFKIIGKQFIEMLPLPLNEKELEKRRIALRKSARLFAEALLDKSPLKPDFGSIIVFYIFRTLCSLAPNILKADHKFFTGLNAYDDKTRWYVNAKISRRDIWMARNIEKSMKKGVNKMLDMEKLKTADHRFRNKL